MTTALSSMPLPAGLFCWPLGFICISRGPTVQCWSYSCHVCDIRRQRHCLAPPPICCSLNYLTAKLPLHFIDLLGLGIRHYLITKLIRYRGQQDCRSDEQQRQCNYTCNLWKPCKMHVECSESIVRHERAVLCFEVWAIVSKIVPVSQ